MKCHILIKNIPIIGIRKYFRAKITLKIMNFYDDFLILYILKLIFVIINKIIFKYLGHELKYEFCWSK